MLFTLSFGRSAISILLVPVLLLCTEVSCFKNNFEPDFHTGQIPKGVVSTNGIGCAEAGIDIMKKGGTAVDAAIATLFCEGVSMPSTMGLGGGFFMTIYKKSLNRVYCLDSREVAPDAATQNMFSGRPELAQTGGLSVAVPGELIGYWRAYAAFGGGVSWSQLPQDAIKKSKNGIYMNPFTAKMVERSKEFVFIDPGLRKVFINPTTNDTYKEGDYYKNPTLAKTLEIIANEGGEALHRGSLTRRFVKDIQRKNGIITVKDMNNYRPKWKASVKTSISGMQLHSFPLPSSGPLLVYMSNILNGFLDTETPFSLTNYQRLAEALKFGYGARTNLGDDDFVDVEGILANITSVKYAVQTRKKIFDNRTSQDPSYYGAFTENHNDHGTAHICVVAPNGDVVSVTSSINYIFGAKFMSESTGIILNDSMDDFSIPGEPNIFGLPPSPTNYIEPGKRPMSSMCPSIILDNGNVFMVIGGAGGSRITSNVLQVIINRLFYRFGLIRASNEERIHHQLFPMILQLENEFLQKKPDIVDGLREIGHKLTFSDPDGFAAVTCISRDNGERLLGVTDKRRGGSVANLY
ncbi:scoloptoxin SSD14 [Leptinotarsa decemlineata]|uniref:scoloptoxin SSD14 n=1 Tax=Leptinotarsa decemlineata TaxID=7539 RepID=UPI003D30C9F1